MSDFTEEQEELFEKPVLTISPCFNGEYVIETYTIHGEFLGRFNATDEEVVIEAIRAALTNGNGPPHFDIN